MMLLYSCIDGLEGLVPLSSKVIMPKREYNSMLLCILDTTVPYLIHC